MSQRVAHYCPICGTLLEQKYCHGRMRPVCPNCGHIVFFDPKVAVVILTLDSDRVLLIQRSIAPGQGKWALPAGFVDAGEDPKAAACREMREETGLDVQIDRLMDVFSTAAEDGLADIVIAYAAHVVNGTLKAADDAADACWFTADSLPELVFFTTQTLIAQWKNDAL